MGVCATGTEAVVTIGEKLAPAARLSWSPTSVMTGDFLRARKSMIRMRIDRSIAYPTASAAGTYRTSLDSLLGVSCPFRARAVSTMENS